MPMRGQLRSTGLLGSAEEPRNLLCLEEDLNDPSKFGLKDGRDDAARQGGGRAAGEGSIEGKVPLGPAGGAACFACRKKPKRPVDSQMFASAERRADLPRAAPPREVGSPFAGLVAIGDARVAGQSITAVAESPHVMFGAQAFCSDHAAASFDCAYGYPRSVGAVAIVLRRPSVVLIAQAVRDGFATASFDAASPHYPRFVGCIPVVAASPLVVFAAQAFCPEDAAASFDCVVCRRYRHCSGEPVGSVWCTNLCSAPLDVTPAALPHTQAPHETTAPRLRL
jgi:hypothetical protein